MKSSPPSASVDPAFTAPETGRKVVLDCGTQGCCPTLHELAHGGVALVGDDGARVELSADQFAQLQKAAF